LQRPLFFCARHWAESSFRERDLLPKNGRFIRPFFFSIIYRKKREKTAAFRRRKRRDVRSENETILMMKKKNKTGKAKG
jgi:hypothetical protein